MAGLFLEDVVECLPYGLACRYPYPGAALQFLGVGIVNALEFLVLPLLRPVTGLLQSFPDISLFHG